VREKGGKMTEEQQIEAGTDVPSATKRSFRKAHRIKSIVMIVTVIYLVSLMVFMVGSTPSYKYYGWPGTSTGTATIGGLPYTTWTVSMHIQSNILKSDVYVQVGNATGFQIATVQLTTASGTHGFLYVPATNGPHIAQGDVFALSTDYKVNCTVTLVSTGGTTQYCELVVPATIPPPSENPPWIIATVVIAAIAVISASIIVQRRRKSRKK